MDYTLQTKDPMVLVKGMDSYFKDIPPDQSNILRCSDNKTVRTWGISFFCIFVIFVIFFTIVNFFGNLFYAFELK